MALISTNSGPVDSAKLEVSKASCPETAIAFRGVTDGDPFGFYEELREQGPVIWDDSVGGWLIPGFEESSFIFKRDDLFLQPFADFEGADVVKGGKRSIVNLRGPEHDAMHRFMSTLLAGPVVNRMRHEVVRPLAKHALDRILPLGKADLAKEYANRLPATVMFAALGLPWQDDQLVEHLSALNEDIARWSDNLANDPNVVSNAIASAKEMRSILLPYVEARGKEPQDDLISETWKGGAKIFEDWTADDVVAQAMILVNGGSGTTRNLTCNSIYLLMTRPGLFEELRDSRGLIPSFVDEVLRLMGAVHWRVRVTLSDVTLGGVQIRKGQKVFAVTGAANRDPAKYKHPDELDLRRRQPKDHLGFGGGPRFCVGAPLARVEVVEMLELLLSSVRNLRLDPAADPPRFRGFLNRRFHPLNARFERA